MREDGREITTHNGLFDLQMVAGLGFDPDKVTDTLLLSQILDGSRKGKGYHTLAACVKRYLGEDLPKDLQKSDWSAQYLTAQQLAYAVRDAEVLRPLRDHLLGLIHQADLGQVAETESRCLPAMVWLARSGVGFDRQAWTALAEEAEVKADILKAQLDQQAPQHPETLFKDWNWNSPAQVKEVFQLLGVELQAADDDALAMIQHPLAELLRDYRSAAKLVSTYGKDWLRHIGPDGRIHAGWRQLGADSGRMSCDKPNLQNLPRDPRYRCCFIAPPGRILIKADYSQIELRIAAKISGDTAMQAAYREGRDLHALTAKAVLGVETVTKDHRQLAKAINFGLLYGMGAPRLQAYALNNYGVPMTIEEAQRYREAFFTAYPGLKAWHRRTGMTDHPIETRTLANRRRQNVQRYTEKLNTPVQGTGADGLKVATALLWERRDQCPGSFPVLVVHDEIVIEADDHQADAAAEWLRSAMVEAMAPLIHPIPVEVEVKTARTWGGD